MATDLIETLSGGELAPYNSGEVFAPTDSWAQNTDVDLLREDHRHAPQTLTFFGTPMPGVTAATVEATLNGMATLFIQDMAALRYPPNLIGFAAKYFRESALKPSRRVRAVHNFELPGELAIDWMAVDFCNHLENVDGGTKRQKQQFLGAAITWLARLAKHANSQTHVSHEQPRMAPINSDPTDQLNDAQYNTLVRHNENVKAQTMGQLRDKWGPCFTQNIELAQQQLNKMTPIERQHFDRWTGSFPWVHALNTVEVLVGLFEMAIGSSSLPTSGPDIAKEILQIEALLREPASRKAYLKDDALQARYRQLLSLTM